jgi:pimeloyl-ACP methyl ester carboxylesterase
VTDSSSQRIFDFFKASPAEQRDQLAQPEVSQAAERYLGAESFAQYRAALQRINPTPTAFGAPKNLVVLPGVMGSMLESHTRGGTWWIDVRTRDEIDKLRLSADGTRDDDIANDVRPTSIDPSYIPFNSAILDQPDFNHEPFTYDWRKLLTASADRLRDLVVSMHADNGGQPVHLVGHSMGGLMLRTALMQHGDQLWPIVGRIVFLGTPHFGSTAMAGYLKNHLWGFEAMAALGLFLSRETFRSLWGILSLLPAPVGIYPGTRANDPHAWTSADRGDPYLHPCANFDMYRADAWHLDLDADGLANLQTALDAVAQFHKAIFDWHASLSADQLGRMLVIAGVGYQTLFRLSFDKTFFGLWDKTTKVTDRVPGDPHREGDSRVPLASAALDNVAIRYVQGVHGGLPNIPAVYEDTFRWLRGQPLELPETPAAALAVPPPPSLAPALDGAGRAMAAPGDDAGVWSLDPTPEQLTKLKAEVETQQPAWFNLTRVL